MKYKTYLYEPITGRDEKKFVNDCLNSNWISSKGKYIERFEKRFSKFIKIRYSITVSNGTAALHALVFGIRRYKEKDLIVPESRLNLTYFDQWDFRNVNKVYNAKDAILSDARNVPMLKQARLDMLEGKWPNACKRCEDEESAGIRSRMQYENERWSADNTWNIEKARAATQTDGSIDVNEVPVVFYDLRFGNLCNLKCRMCGPTDSSQWYEDQVKMFGNTYQDTQGIVNLQKDGKGKYKPVVDIYGWYENSSLWGQLEENMSKIRHLYLVGGEPLMINEHYAFLQKCVDRGEASHIVLEYNTNITNIPDRAWNIWKHFERIEIGASVDGIGKVVEYIRHPVKWEIIERNMWALDNAEGNFKLWLAPTIGILNSKNIAVTEIRFRNVYPISLGSLSYDIKASDVDYLQVSASFNYMYYDIVQISSS